MAAALKELGVTFIICGVIAFLTGFFNEGSYWTNLRVSLVFGLSIVFLVNTLSLPRFQLTKFRILSLGYFGGFAIGMVHLLLTMFGDLNWALLAEYKNIVLFNFAFSIVVSAVVFYLFFSTYRIQKLRREMAEHAASNAEKDRQLAISELKLLQGQIEPHFLFNSLANLQGLVDSDPSSAKLMIQSLSAMLRVSLKRSRADKVTLAEELALVRHYLEIQKIRLGDRLSFEIELPDELRQVNCPPLLLQPLVENALIHGIEPSAKGGIVDVICVCESDQVTVQIHNTGVGFGESRHQGHGVGLQNVRERLALLYGESAMLRIQPMSGESGTEVSIQFPVGINTDKE